MSKLEASYDFCRQVVKQSDSNFSYPLLLLPRQKRRAMYALYAYLRYSDDIADSQHPIEHRRLKLERWKQALQRALSGHMDDSILPALVDTVQRFEIPHEYLYEVLRGVDSDLDVQVFHTFFQLEQYCYRVASVVGLACVHIWGYHGDEALEPARKCGIAFQMTNILRDLKEDAANGRIYLPQEDFTRFDYSSDDLKRGIRDHRFEQLMNFELQRSEQLYEEAFDLLHYLHPDGHRVFRAMYATYHSLLHEIKRRNGDVFSEPVQLGHWKKMWIALSVLIS